MIRKVLIAAILATITLQTSPVFADKPGWSKGYGGHDKCGRYEDDRHYYREHEREHSRGYYYPKGRYYSHEHYYEPRRMSRHDHVWVGRDGRYHCRRDDGTAGLVFGMVLGGLVGHEVTEGGDQTLGTLLGAAGGAILGREIDRGNVKCY